MWAQNRVRFQWHGVAVKDRDCHRPLRRVSLYEGARGVVYVNTCFAVSAKCSLLKHTTCDRRIVRAAVVADVGFYSSISQ